MTNVAYFVYARHIKDENDTSFSFFPLKESLINFEEIAENRGYENYFRNIESLVDGIIDYEDMMADLVDLSEIDFHSDWEDYIYYDNFLKSEIHYRSLSDEEMKELKKRMNSYPNLIDY